MTSTRSITTFIAVIFALPACAHDGTVIHELTDAIAYVGIVVLALGLGYWCLGIRRTR